MAARPLSVLPVCDDALDLIVEVLRHSPIEADVPFTSDTLAHSIMRWLERNYNDLSLVDALKDAREQTPPAEDFELLRLAHVRACQPLMH